MLFKKSHSVETGTTEEAPDTKVINVSKGLLNLWVVYVTQESGDYLNVRVLYHGVQVYPFTMGQQIKAWFVPIPVTARLKIDTPPYELTVEAWNTAPTNSHEYHVHCNIEPDRPISVVEEEPGVLEGIWQRLFGE